MPNVSKVLIVGGGIGGLALSIGLRRAGIDVEIAEIKRQWTVYHVGIIAQSNLVRAMVSLGIADDCVAAGFPYQGLRFCDANGNVMNETPGMKLAGPNYPAFLGLTRPALHDVLFAASKKAGAQLHLGVSVAELRQSESDVAVRFTDGSAREYDLVVGGDGVHSQLRTMLFGDHLQPRFTGEGVWRYNVPRRHFDDLILGLEMDLTGARYRTFEDLAVYCYRVAGAIGLISIEVFGYRNPCARDYAVNLGIALQLVNILRDIQSDARRGRIYLPEEDLERFGVRPDELRAGERSDAFIELMQFECDRARSYFDQARRMLAFEDRRSMVAAEIMAAIYWRLLGAIRQRGYNVLGERVRLSRPLKFWIALAVYLGWDWRSSAAEAPPEGERVRRG